MEDKVRVIVVDDHKSFAEGLATILQKKFPGFEIHTHSSASDVIAIFESDVNFQLLITDISMPGMTGIELTKIVKEKYPTIKVLVLSMHNEPGMVRAIMDAEAEGYVLKNSSAAEIVTAIQDILNNSTHYGREILSVLVNQMSQEKKKQEVLQVLSQRELEVLQLIVEELSSEQIAEKLFISKRTVDAHRANIMEKTGSQNLVSLIKFAIRNNLFSR